MITLLTGSPGHGKSYTLCREIERAVGKGEPVATNVPLAPDWPEVMARRHTLLWRLRPKAVQRKADVFKTLVLATSNFAELLRVRLAGEGEGRGKLILDESQRWMNTRGYDTGLNADGTVMKRAEALAVRMGVVNHLSGHRHYGFDVILATQSAKAIDPQARDLYEFHSEVRNMRKLPWIGVIIRFNLFVKVTKWNDHSKSKAGIDAYFLSKSLARLYQTHALQASDWPADAIVLPRDAEIPIRNGTGGSGELESDSLAIGNVYRLPNGQFATVKTGNKESLETIDRIKESATSIDGLLPDTLIDSKERSEQMASSSPEPIIGSIVDKLNGGSSGISDASGELDDDLDDMGEEIRGEYMS